MNAGTLKRLIITLGIISSHVLAGPSSCTKSERLDPGGEPAAAVMDTGAEQAAELALELLTGMPDNVLDPDVPALFTVNLFSPLAFSIHERNRDRKTGTDPGKSPDISTLIDGQPWWERLSLLNVSGGTEKDIPFQVLGQPVQSELSLGEGGVSSCRIAVGAGELSGRNELFVSIVAAKLTIRSANIDVRIEPETLSPVQKLEAWIPYHMALGETDAAVAKGRDLVALAPEFSSSYSYLSEALEAAGELEEAVDRILKAIDLFEKAGEGEDPPFLYLEQLQRLQKTIKEKK